MNARRLAPFVTAGAVAVVLLAMAKAFAAEPFLEKLDLFESGMDGYALYRIPGVVVTKKGTVLAWCEARKTGKGDWGPIDTMLRRSSDGGGTWTPRQCIVHVEGELPVNPVAAAQNLDQPGDNTADNPVGIADRETGAVHFFYCLEYMRCFSMRSEDDGATWTKPVEITGTFEQLRKDYDWKVIATGPGHGIQLTHGPHKGRQTSRCPSRTRRPGHCEVGFIAETAGSGSASQGTGEPLRSGVRSTCVQGGCRGQAYPFRAERIPGIDP